MHFHNITKDDMLNGEGLRVVLWVAGCPHKCEGCHNPITWDECGGIEFTEESENELFEILNRPYISGITFSGGDPLHMANRSEIARLIDKCKTLFPLKTIWLYTGFLWEDICDLDLIKKVDVVVDGKFEKALHDPKLFWKGSSNQRVIDVRKTLECGSVITKGKERE